MSQLSGANAARTVLSIPHATTLPSPRHGTVTLDLACGMVRITRGSSRITCIQLSKRGTSGKILGKVAPFVDSVVRIDFQSCCFATLSTTGKNQPRCSCCTCLHPITVAKPSLFPTLCPVKISRLLILRLLCQVSTRPHSDLRPFGHVHPGSLFFMYYRSPKYMYLPSHCSWGHLYQSPPCQFSPSRNPHSPKPTAHLGPSSP